MESLHFVYLTLRVRTISEMFKTIFKTIQKDELSQFMFSLVDILYQKLYSASFPIKMNCY